MKYQRLALLTRQLAAVTINTTPGLEEPVKPEDIFKTAFDEPEPEPQLPEYTAEEWEDERQRLLNLFDLRNGKS